MNENQRTKTANSAPGQTDVPPRRHARLWPWIVGILILLLAVIAFLTHRHSGQTGASRRGAMAGPVMVSTVTTHKGNLAVYLEALGIVTPVYTVNVEARVAGQITKVNYQEGQHVKVGDPLVDIDPRPYEAAVLQAKGQLEHDAAQLKDAQLDLDRYKEAFESNAIPKQQYDTQMASVQQDEGSVELDQGNLDNANVNLAYCQITSPIAGRVGLRLVDPGNIVQANGTTPLVVITQVKPITVVFEIAEDDISQILSALHGRKNLAMEIYDREDQTNIATGTLATLDNEINTTSGTLKMRGICSNEDESLFPNQFVNVHLLVKTLQGITLLPNTAIQRNSESAFVYLLKSPESGQTNETVELRTITVGATDGTVSQVNLDPGDIVAADNFNRLSDGTKVVIRPSGSQAQGEGAGQRNKKKSQ